MATKTYEAGRYSTFDKIRVNVLTECPKCGQLFSGTVYTYRTDWETVSKVARTSVKSCHICKTKFMQKEEYSLLGAGVSAASKKELAEKITSVEADICREDIAKQMTKRVKTVDDMPANNAVVQKVKSDIPSLKSYIQQLIDLEIWACFIREHIVSIEAEKTLFHKAVIHASGSDSKSAEKAAQEKEKELLKEISKLKKEFAAKDWSVNPETKSIVAPQRPQFYSERVPEKPVPPVLKSAGLFNKKKVTAENEQLQQEYAKACAVYEQQLCRLETVRYNNRIMREQYEEKLRKYYDELDAEKTRAEQEAKKLKAESARKKKEAKEELETKIEEIRQKIENLKNPSSSEVTVSYIETVLKKDKESWLKLLKTVCDSKNKLYSANVIYPNYRDLFALSSFYEYLNSERCYELEGPDGAYNLYERERRSDVVSTFFRKIEDVSKNQVILYKETSKMFKNLKTLDDCMKEATKAVADKKSDVTDEFVDETLKKYFDDSEVCRNDIMKSAESAAEYTK